MTTDAHNGACFNGAQQCGLQVKRHVTNFIKKESSTMRLFKFPSTSLPISTGEGAAFVAKEFCIDQLTWDGCTVDRDKRPVCPRTPVVDALRENFFPGPSLSLQEYSGVALCRQPGQP